MTQLLQSTLTINWLGVFLHARRDTDDAITEGSTVIRLGIGMRPLLGWTTAEGGWQGLYHDERTSRLVTPIKLGENNGSPRAEHCIHLGDFAMTAPLRIRKAQASQIRDRLIEFVRLYEKELDVTVSKTPLVKELETAGITRLLRVLDNDEQLRGEHARQDQEAHAEEGRGQGEGDQAPGSPGTGT